MCKENKLELEEELEKKQRLLKQFCGYGYEFEGSYRKNVVAYQDNVLKDDSP